MFAAMTVVSFMMQHQLHLLCWGIIVLLPYKLGCMIRPGQWPCDSCERHDWTHSCTAEVWLHEWSWQLVEHNMCHIRPYLANEPNVGVCYATLCLNVPENLIIGMIRAPHEESYEQGSAARHPLGAVHQYLALPLQCCL